MASKKVAFIGAAVAASLCLALAAGHQNTTPFALPGEVRGYIQNERFGIVTSLRGLPLGVRGELQTMFGSYELDIAEPRAAFQERAAADSLLPSRRLVSAGCSHDHCLVYYERGGDSRSWRVMLFHWSPEETRFVWGGAAPGGLTTIDDVRRAILAGGIESAGGDW